MVVMGKGYRLDRRHGLTKRERQVATLIDEGRPQVAIAAILGVSRQRVEQLVRSVERKRARMAAESVGPEG